LPVDDLGAAGDLLPDVLVRLKRAVLVDVAELHRIAKPDRAIIGLFLSVSMRNSVVLPAPLGPITPTMPPGGSLNDRSSIKTFPS
jgi:hypothetical protein